MMREVYHSNYVDSHGNALLWYETPPTYHIFHVLFPHLANPAFLCRQAVDALSPYERENTFHECVEKLKKFSYKKSRSAFDDTYWQYCASVHIHAGTATETRKAREVPKTTRLRIERQRFILLLALLVVWSVVFWRLQNLSLVFCSALIVAFGRTGLLRERVFPIVSRLKRSIYFMCIYHAGAHPRHRSHGKVDPVASLLRSVTKFVVQIWDPLKLWSFRCHVQSFYIFYF